MLLIERHPGDRNALSTAADNRFGGPATVAEIEQ
jgi:hypothetical protein